MFNSDFKIDNGSQVGWRQPRLKTLGAEAYREGFEYMCLSNAF